jgi:lysophospholipase L1-like esterase
MYYMKRCCTLLMLLPAMLLSSGCADKTTHPEQNASASVTPPMVNGFYPATEKPWQAAPRQVDYAWGGRQAWHNAHAQQVAMSQSYTQQRQMADIVLLGDSITQGWAMVPEIWQQHFAGKNTLNLGIGGDTTQNLLWRMTTGQALKGLNPKVVVVLIGTNNFGLYNDTAEDTVRGVQAIMQTLRDALPSSKLILMGILPRGTLPEDEVRQRVKQANQRLAVFAQQKNMIFMDIGTQLLNPNGTLNPEIMPDGLHLSAKGYAIWAQALRPHLLNAY